MKILFIYIPFILICMIGIPVTMYCIQSCEVHKVYRQDTLKYYDTVKVIRIEDCTNYVINLSAMDSAGRAELKKILDEFIRRSNLTPNTD